MKVQVEFFDVDLFIMMCHCRFKIEKIDKNKQNKTKQKHKAEAVRRLGLYRCFQFSIFSIATFT